MLQKPSQKSKPRDHAKYLTSRLARWKDGQLKSLMDEASAIQRRLKEAINKSDPETKEEKKAAQNQKEFVKLMLLGKIGDAAKKVNNEDAVKGVHQLDDEIKQILLDKHPVGRNPAPDILMQQTSTAPQPVIYEEITSESVYRTAKNMKGSGGPTLVDADTWKQFLCSKVYGNASIDLCQAISDLAKILSTEEVHPDCMTEYIAGRLVPLDKGNSKEGKPGVRPVGVGEVLRRLVGKLLIGVIKDDITTAAGPLQTCTGVKAGIEAAIHAMRAIFQDEGTEAVLLVDAENAFNNLNRKAALHNIKELCPTFHRYLMNTYQKPAELIVPGKDRYEIIYSEEGSTQGDVAAMAMYGIALKPLTDNLAAAVDPDHCKQVWYADDSTAAGKIVEMRKWWDTLCQQGPEYGYFPLPRKTVLIVKPEEKEKAINAFLGTGVQITTDGERHMGAVIGSPEFKEKYVTKKVEKWVHDIEQLSQIAQDEPQAVYASFTKAICHRWTYVQRTIPNIDHLFQPLEDAIREKLIPSLIGREVSDTERRILALPVRLGGMGIRKPTDASIEFSASKKITQKLSNIIYNQEADFGRYDPAAVAGCIVEVKRQKEKMHADELISINEAINEKMKRTLELAQEKGSGAWLTALPIQALGYTLNKQEFRDSVCLRYGWDIPNTPSFCQCGKENNIDHSLNCKKGGYIIMRHNRVRDLEAELMKEVCHNVQIEPQLLPIESDHERDGNTATRARLDVAGVGVWGAYEKTFLDIRIMHPNSPSYINQPIEQVYSTHEKLKKRSYNERVLQVEKGSFTPIVMSTSGGEGKEAARHHKRISTLIAEKRNESYADVINYVRTRLRFSVLRSTLTAIRGVRGKARAAGPISDVSFNLIEQ